MYAVQLDDVRVIAERTQQHNFAKRSLCIGLVPECVEDFFDGNRLLGALVCRLPNNAVGAFAESLFDGWGGEENGNWKHEPV